MIAFLIGFFLIILAAIIVLPILGFVLQIVFTPIAWILQKIFG